MSFTPPYSFVDPISLRRRGTGVIAMDPGLAGPGYTLLPLQTGGGAVHLISMTGDVVHSWNLAMRPGRHAVMLPNGNLGFNGHLESAPALYPSWDLWRGGAFQEVRPDGEVVWEFCDSFHHHDGQWLPNGNILYGACEPAPSEFARRIVGGYEGDCLSDGVIYCDVVREVNRQGETVWEWKAWEHLDPNAFPIASIFNRHHWPLINGLNVTRAGLVLMSLRTTSGVIGVDRATGSVRFCIDRSIVSHQHSPSEMNDGAILIFDNGNLRPGSSTPYSRVIEVDPATAAVTWEYSDPFRPAFFSPYMGSAQRLANGNTHITESATGRLFDVTPSGKVVWEYVIPWFSEYSEPTERASAGGEQNSVFRSYRYMPEQIPWL